MSEFSHLKNKLLAEQVEDQIYHYILDEALEPGAKLPNEFALGEKFRVGRSTIREAVKLLHLFDSQKDVSKVTPQVGPEQEYFLIDKKLYLEREDLRLCGRTLFGAKPPKGQELEDHYFGTIRPRVAAYMKDLDSELWKLGVLSKTRHNEVAPAQHELAPIYTDANTASDQNQLEMEVMQKVADRHGLVWA